MPCIRGILVEILYCNIRWRRIFECDLWYFSDVTGVEIAGALKNVLAIAAGIVEGMNLGNNCMAALVAQGCSEIRWLATKVCNIYHLHFHCLWSLKTCYIHWHGINFLNWRWERSQQLFLVCLGRVTSCLHVLSIFHGIEVWDCVLVQAKNLMKLWVLWIRCAAFFLWHQFMHNTWPYDTIQ